MSGNTNFQFCADCHCTGQSAQWGHRPFLIILHNFLTIYTQISISLSGRKITHIRTWQTGDEGEMFSVKVHDEGHRCAKTNGIIRWEEEEQTKPQPEEHLTWSIHNMRSFINMLLHGLDNWLWRSPDPELHVHTERALLFQDFKYLVSRPLCAQFLMFINHKSM